MPCLPLGFRRVILRTISTSKIYHGYFAESTRPRDVKFGILEFCGQGDFFKSHSEDLDIVIFQKVIFYPSLIETVSFRFLDDKEDYCSRGIVFLMSLCKTFC